MFFIFRLSLTFFLVIEWPEESAWFLTREGWRMMSGRGFTLLGILFWSLPLGAVLHFINRWIAAFTTYSGLSLLPLTLLNTLFFMWVALAWVAFYEEIKE